MSKDVTEGDLIQVNEDGPHHWFRCILVVDERKSWGVQAYCTIPGAPGRPGGDAFMRLEWDEFDVLGVKSKFIVGPTMETERKENPNADELDVRGADSNRGHGAAVEGKGAQGAET